MTARLCLGCEVVITRGTRCAACSRKTRGGGWWGREGAPSSGGVWQATRARILERDGYTCCLCRTPGSLRTLVVDHRISLSRGGDSSDANLWTLCRLCHNAKTAEEQRGGGAGQKFSGARAHRSAPTQIFPRTSSGGS